MKHTLSLILLSLIGLISCKKHKIDINNPATKHITLNGVFTNIKGIQMFTIDYSKKMDDNNPSFIEDANLQVIHGMDTFKFNHLVQGYYSSIDSFAGIAGEPYSIEVKHENQSGSINSIMPHPIEINAISFSQEDSFLNKDLILSLNSPVQQHFSYNLFEADKEILATDTVWVKKESGFSEILEITNNVNQSITLFALKKYFSKEDNQLIKIDIQSIDQNVAMYLKNLSDYRADQSTLNQYLNTPPFYSNNVYGLGYGTCLSSIIYQF